MVDQLGQVLPLELPLGDHVDEDADGPTCHSRSSWIATF